MLPVMAAGRLNEAACYLSWLLVGWPCIGDEAACYLSWLLVGWPCIGAKLGSRAIRE